MVLFTVVAVATVNSILTRPLIPRLRIARRYLWVLFTELVMNGIVGFAGQAAHHLGNRLETTTEEFGLTQSGWQTASSSWMDEPSGLATSDLLAPRSNRPLFVGVDDEEDAIFVLDVMPDARSNRTKWLVVRAMLPLSWQKGSGRDEPVTKDLESIAYDRQGRFYYALTSHRVGVRGSILCKLLKFKIPDSWETAGSEISIGSDDCTDLSAAGEGVSRLTLANLVAWKAPGFSEPIWRQEKKEAKQKGKGDLEHKYQLEIEGLAYRDGYLYMGLKWPLDKDRRPLLLAYSTASGQFVAILSLDLSADPACGPGDWGIRTLDVFEDYLIVGADQWTKDPGQCSLQAFSLTDIEAGVQAFRPPDAQGHSVAKALKAVANVTAALLPRNAFLEGIAIGDSDVILGYDKPPAGTPLDLAATEKIRDRIKAATGANQGTQ